MATQVVKKVPEAKPSVIQPMIYKSVVTVYRIFAILTLYVVLIGVLAYGFVMGFYALNTSWAGPVILSPADDKSSRFHRETRDQPPDFGGSERRQEAPLRWRR